LVVKQGIHLGTSVPTTARLARPVFWLLFLFTLGHGVLYVHDLREVSSLQSDVEAREAALRGAAPSTDASSRSLALSNTHLEAALELGVSERPFVSVLLDEIAARLPPSVTLTSLGISFRSGASTPVLVLDGIAADSSSVGTLQEGLDASPAVERTQVLEERRIPSGGIAVRLQLDLKRAAAP
jgi:hypothetical protein